MFQKYITWVIFFRSRFSLNNIHKFKKTCQWFTPGVFQGVYFKVFIFFFVHCFGIIMKEKCSPFNQGIIQQPIMSINNVITPMTELSEPPSYMLYMSRVMRKKNLIWYSSREQVSREKGNC